MPDIADFFIFFRGADGIFPLRPSLARKHGAHTKKGEVHFLI
jgi:hypothetical protein